MQNVGGALRVYIKEPCNVKSFDTTTPLHKSTPSFIQVGTTKCMPIIRLDISREMSAGMKFQL